MKTVILDNMEEKESRIRNAIYTNNNYGTSLEFGYDEEKLKKENRYRVTGQAFPEKLNQFNWGACLLTPVWGLFNNTPAACLIILLGFIPYLGLLFAIIFSLYCGAKGNEWAWKNKEWKDIKHFHEVQKKWAIAGVLIELITIIIFSYTAMNLANQIMQNAGY